MKRRMMKKEKMKEKNDEDGEENEDRLGISTHWASSANDSRHGKWHTVHSDIRRKMKEEHVHEQEA